ncbi:MAG: dihydroorotase [Thermodesulfobacteriota bacterium]
MPEGRALKRLFIKGGRVVDPASGVDGPFDVHVAGGTIAAVLPRGDDSTGRSEGAADQEVIDASGMLVLPGLVDLHTHLREPGYEYKETVATGAAAAKAGGFTAIACMANTEPVADNASVIRFILRKAESTGINVHPVGAVTVGLEGRSLTEMADLKEAGCVAVSDDGRPVMDPALMRRALEYSKALGLVVITHAEDAGFAGAGVMNEGVVSTRLGLTGVPNAAEDAMVARDVMLAELAGARLHVAHVSTRGSVEIIRAAKARGVKVTAEATPHHLTLTDEAVDGYDTNARMNPPLRSRDDVEAVTGGLADGTIDCVATDHAPHSVIEKDVEFDAAANGIIGLETAFPLVYGLVEEGVIGLCEAVAAMTVKPARLLGLDHGTLRVGSSADIAIVDPERRWTVDPEKLRSRSKNTPWAGKTMKGRVEMTICRGEVVYRA